MSGLDGLSRFINPLIIVLLIIILYNQYVHTHKCKILKQHTEEVLKKIKPRSTVSLPIVKRIKTYYRTMATSHNDYYNVIEEVLDVKIINTGDKIYMDVLYRLNNSDEIDNRRFEIDKDGKIKSMFKPGTGVSFKN